MIKKKEKMKKKKKLYTLSKPLVTFIDSLDNDFAAAVI